MPRFNGTGPAGQGPGTGWGQGPCGAGSSRGFYGYLRRGWSRFNRPGSQADRKKMLEEEEKMLEGELAEVRKAKAG